MDLDLSSYKDQLTRYKRRSLESGMKAQENTRVGKPVGRGAWDPGSLDKTSLICRIASSARCTLFHLLALSLCIKYSSWNLELQASSLFPSILIGSLLPSPPPPLLTHTLTVYVTFRFATICEQETVKDNVIFLRNNLT